MTNNHAFIGEVNNLNNLDAKSHFRSHTEKAAVSKIHLEPFFTSSTSIIFTRHITLSCSRPLLSLKHRFALYHLLSQALARVQAGGRNKKYIKMAQETEEMSERESRINLSPVCFHDETNPCLHAQPSHSD